jgi:hypothetical protein
MENRVLAELEFASDRAFRRYLLGRETNGTLEIIEEFSDSHDSDRVDYQ